jgi:hypothetical protein
VATGAGVTVEAACPVAGPAPVAAGLQQLPAYRGGTLRRDLLAGLSPVAGLYALLLPTVAYTLFGSSRQLIVGPEGSIAALVATALVPLAADDPERYGSLAALLALLVGACFLVAGVIRLGWMADYFSHRPVLRRPPRQHVAADTELTAMGRPTWPPASPRASPSGPAARAPRRLLLLA